jgi:hypothetical protein
MILVLFLMIFKKLLSYLLFWVDPLTNGGISKSIKEKINTFKRFSNGLKFLPSHSAYFLFK